MSTRRPIDQVVEAPLLHALAQRLRELRVAADLSQAELADRALLTTGHISLLEHGQRRTRRSTLERIASALNRPELTDELCALAGESLATESDYAERVARRRDRRYKRGLTEHAQ